MTPFQLHAHFDAFLTQGGVSCTILTTTTTTISTSPAFHRTSKRRRGFPSETHVKRGVRVVHGDKELLERLGRNDPCPCGSNRCFQELLPAVRPLLTARTATTIRGEVSQVRRACGLRGAADETSPHDVAASSTRRRLSRRRRLGSGAPSKRAGEIRVFARRSDTGVVSEDK